MEINIYTISKINEPRTGNIRPSLNKERIIGIGLKFFSKPETEVFYCPLCDGGVGGWSQFLIT